jgi:hypothetical protein
MQEPRWTVWDEAAYRLRKPIFIATIFAAPVMMISYVYAMRMLADFIGVGWFAAVMACHAITWLGIGCLLDKQSGLVPPKRDGQARRRDDQ